jgi:hypothetical protein
MKNLARLTWSANKTVRLVNRSSLPVCPENECKRRVEYLPTRQATQHCYKHMTEAEAQEWAAAWDKYSDEVVTK